MRILKDSIWELSTGPTDYEGSLFRRETNSPKTKKQKNKNQVFNKHQSIESKDLSQLIGSDYLAKSSHSCKSKYVFPKAEGWKI